MLFIAVLTGLMLFGTSEVRSRPASVQDHQPSSCGTLQLPSTLPPSRPAQSTMVQNVSVCVYLVLISFIIFAGASQVDQANYTPFAPFGIDVSPSQGGPRVWEAE